MIASPDLVELDGLQLMWDYYGAHPFGYWTTLDDRKEYRMCYGKEQTTHKETSSRFYAECVNSLLDDFQYERANELEWLLEEYEKNKENYIEDLEVFYYDNYSGDFDDYTTFKQIIKFKEANGDITYGQINEIVDNNKDAYDDIIYDYTGLYSKDFYSLINSDSDFQFSSRKFNDWFYNETQYNGRIWTEDYIICMYNDENLSPGEMRRVITDLSKASGIPIMKLLNYTYLRDKSWDGGEGILSWTIRGFIHGDEPKILNDGDGSSIPTGEDDAKDSNGRPLHLQSPYEKWRKLKDFRRVRDDKNVRQNMADGWKDASQAEINWWKNRGLGDSIIRNGKLIENKQYNRNNMKKKLIRLTEVDLHRIVKESVNKLLNEIGKTGDYQRKLGALQARKVINADGETIDDFFDNQAKEGGKIYGYAKNQRSEFGNDTDEFGNTINPLYKDYTRGYTDYLNAHPEEMVKRHEKLTKLGYYG